MKSRRSDRIKCIKEQNAHKHITEVNTYECSYNLQWIYIKLHEYKSTQIWHIYITVIWTLLSWTSMCGSRCSRALGEVCLCIKFLDIRLLTAVTKCCTHIKQQHNERVSRKSKFSPDSYEYKFKEDIRIKQTKIKHEDKTIHIRVKRQFYSSVFRGVI